MIEVDIAIEAAVGREMAALRETSHEDFVCGIDEFDNQAIHITAWHGRDPIGMVRLTTGPSYALVKWSEGRIAIEDDGVAEMTRGVVHPSFRRHGIYKCLMWESMIRSALMDKRAAFAAVKPTFPGKPFLESLGFRDVQGTCVLQGHFFVQPIRCILDRRDRWLADYSAHATKLRSNGVLIRSELPSILGVP